MVVARLRRVEALEVCVCFCDGSIYCFLERRGEREVARGADVDEATGSVLWR